MANLNIKFNNKNYSIDSTLLADATAGLEAHLVAMMDEPAEPEKMFKTIVYNPGVGAVEFCAMAAQEGMTAVDEAVLPTKTTEDIKISDMNAAELHLYYIEDENDIFVYCDMDGDGAYEWTPMYILFGDMPHFDVIEDISEATEKGYYALIYTDTPDGDVAL